MGVTGGTRRRAGQDGRRLLLWSVLVVGACGALLLAGCGAGADSGITVSLGTSDAPPAGTQSSTREAAKPTETAAPGVVASLGEFVRRFGWPPDTDFGRLRIPSISVDAQIGARVVGPDGTMPNPAGPADVVWYDMSAWAGMGGAPGQGGNAIFSGHVDYDYVVPHANVRYRGKGVFASLHQLRRGDVIEVERNGETLRYAVVWQRQLPVSSGTNWAEMWTSAVVTDSITLYTCAGSFDANIFEYSDRLFVRAERI